MRSYIDISQSRVNNGWVSDAGDDDATTYVLGSLAKKNLVNTNGVPWVMVMTNKPIYESYEIPEGVNLKDYGVYGNKNGITVYINGEDVCNRNFVRVGDYRKLSTDKGDYLVFYPDSATLVKDAFVSLHGVTSFALEFKAKAGAPALVDVVDGQHKWRRVNKTTYGTYKLDAGQETSIENLVPVAVDLSDSGWRDIGWSANFHNVIGVDVNTGRVKLFRQETGYHKYTSEFNKLNQGTKIGKAGLYCLASSVGDAFETPAPVDVYVLNQFTRNADYNWEGYKPVASDLSSSDWESADNVLEYKVGIDVVLGRFKFNINEGRIGEITSDYNHYIPSAHYSNVIASGTGDGCYRFDSEGNDIHITDKYGKGLEDMGGDNDDDNPMSWIVADTNFGYGTLNGVNIYIDEDGKGPLQPKDVTLYSYKVMGGTAGPVLPVATNLSMTSWRTDDNVRTNTVGIDVVTGRFKFYSIPTGVVSTRYNYKPGTIILVSDDGLVTVIIPVDAIDAYTELSIVPTSLPTNA
ncbi:MAG: hypothetical protein ABIJ12_14835, partial [bacterium]